MDVGTEVWIKCDDAVWAPGVVLDCQEMHVTGVVKIKAASGDIVTRRYLGDGDEMNEIFLRNKRRDFANLSCLIVLEYLHEPALLHALSERFAHDRIYTSIGDILLAVNPFKDLDLYTDAVIEQYKVATIASVKTTGGAAAAALDATDGSGAGACPPHVFAIAGRAFSGLLRTDAKNQSILVSGESGSGKTESTKFLMKFLTSVGHDFSSAAATLSPHQAPPHDNRTSLDEDDLAPAGDITEIGKRILQTNPILESFGNARTIRNDNSSRFGKFIKIQFDAQNQIIGAEIASYLLEKVRLIHQSPQERNFHIFYELLEGADSALLESLGLERGAKYELLNAYGSGPPSSGGSGRSVTFAGVKRKNPLAAQYSKRYQQTVQAFADTGVEDGERTLIFQILAALLHLGNVNFEQVATTGSPEEAAVVTEKSSVHLEKCSELLGVEVEKLKSLLLTREITAGSDTVTLKLNAEQSKDASRSFAKAIYGRLFTWLVSRLSDGINYRDYLSPQEQNEIKTIGILDIFGFESLEENGFEQLCINYANERLQAQFNEFVFIKEQDIYVSQGIDWRSISYPSNAACLALFDEKVNGLFSLLDQECMMPKGSNQALCTKYYRSHGGTDITETLLQPQLSQRYTLPLLVTSFGRYLQHSSSSTVSDKDDNEDKSRPFTASKMDRVNKQFSIKHFAGKVTYRVDQFLEKNQDSLPTDASVVLTTSENDIVAMIGAGEGVEDAPESNGRGRARSRSRSSLLRAPSVSFQFRGQLDLLIDEIGQTEAHYIRCLKPNEEKKSRAFDRHRMVEQLRSVGVLEALRIARAGYSARLSHETFVDSFSCYRYKLEKSGQSVPTELADLCKALFAALLDEANADKMDGKPPVKTMLKVDNAKFNDAVREYGVQLGKSIVFCKTAAYNTFIRLRLRVRDQAARILQRYGRGFVHRDRYLKQRRAALMIQAQVRRHQAVQFFGRMRTLRQRVAAYCIQRCMRETLVRQRSVDEKIRLHRLRRGFANFKLGCALKAQEEEELLKEARRIEEEQVGENHVTDSEEEREQQRLQRKASSRGKGIARNTRSHERVEVSKSTRRLRSSSEEPEGEQGDDQSLRSEIERLQKLLGEQKAQKPAMQRRPSGRTTRSRVTSLDASNARRHRSRRAMSIEKSDGMSEADDEDTDDAAYPAPRRAQSVRLARDADHVSKLTRRLEELDAKCRQLERLVARPPGPYDYPPSRGSSRRRYSIANSDGSNGGQPDYPFDQQSNGGGSATSGVENLIWSIQQQMDTLRQSVASKAEEDTAAIQARHDGHSMSFASSLPTRSSTVTSNGSSTNQPFDGPLHEDAETNGYPSLPSPSRTNSDPHFSYRGYSFHGAMTPPTPASEASFRMGGVPRHPNAATGYPYGPPPPVVKWSRSTHCHECNDPFTLFVRRHHCRMCGNSFCHDHSNRRVTLLGMGFDDEPQRVCDACFAEYQAQASASPDYFPPLPTPTSVRGGAPPQHFGAPMYRQRSFSQQYYPPPPTHPHQYHAQVPRTPQRQHHHQPQQPYYGGWAPPPPPHSSSHTSAA